jgi:hypothetical protein
VERNDQPLPGAGLDRRQRDVLEPEIADPRLDATAAWVPEIAALTPEIQPLRGGAEWRWQITAVDSGRLELALTVNALIDVTEDGVPLNNAVVPIKVFEETIDVEVGVFPRVSGFFRSNFFWLGPFLLVPLAGIGWDRVRRRLK